MSRFTTLLGELRRRKVWLVGCVYLAASWILIQLVSVAEEPLSLPGWFDTGAFVVLGIGFPIALILAWAQETPAKSETAERAAQPASREPDPPSIAVLPFENMSDDRDQEYLADGMTEELINLLTNFQLLRVTARSSSFAYKGTSPDIRAAGQELGVRYVVEGSIRRVGDNIRVTAQLVRTSDGSHVWSNTYDRSITEIFAVQDEVVEAICDTLRVKIVQAEDRRIRAQPPASLDAWALLMRADQIIVTDRVSRDEQLSLIRESLKIDPEYARANSMMAAVLANNVVRGFTHNSDAIREQVEYHAELAMDGGQSVPGVLMNVAAAYGGMGDRQRALKLSERARELFGRPWSAHAGMLGAAGRIDEAITELKDVMAESPTSVGGGLARDMGRLLAIRGDYEEALPFAVSARDTGALDPMLHADLANLYGHLGRIEEAREAWAKAQKLAPGFTVKARQSGWRQSYGTDEAAEALTGGFRKAGIVN